MHVKNKKLFKLCVAHSTSFNNMSRQLRSKSINVSIIQTLLYTQATNDIEQGTLFLWLSLKRTRKKVIPIVLIHLSTFFYLV